MDKFDKLGDASDEQKARLGKIQDLARRFDEGAPADNISGAEAAATYRAVSKQLSPEQMEEATAEALSKLPVEERQQVSNWMKQAGGDQLGDLDDDPRHLAAASRQLGSSQAGGLDGLLGGLLGGAQKQSGGGASDLLDNPLIKTVLAGVASVAMSKFLGSSGSGGGGLSGLLGGLLGGGGGGDGRSSGQSGGIGDILGGILGGGGGGSQGGGGGLDDILGGLIGGSGGGSQGGGGIDDVLGGLLGGQDGGQKPPSKRNVL